MSAQSQNTIEKKDILFLFYRMHEPLYYPKGDPEECCVFELSPDYLPNQYQDKAPQMLTRFNDSCDGHRVDIAPLLHDSLLRIPLDRVQVVKRHDQFSLFIPQHRKAAGRLLSLFLGLKNTDDLIAFAAYARDRVNSQLFVYALSTALLHREDTKDLVLPSYAEVFPERYIYSDGMCDAREMAEIFPNPSERTPIEIPRDYTGNDSDPEHRLAYFREDVGVNLHHWHWHLIYPFEGPDVVVRKDRRGELFYHLHHQIVARYNVERLCNHLDLVNPLVDWDEPIAEGYFPMMNTEIAGKDWPGRPPNMRMSNISRPDRELRFDIEHMRRFKERIYEAIHRGRVIGHDGNDININNDQGIDVLGNMIEASVLTPNALYYGDLHNLGHLALAFIHDPQYRYMQTNGVMADTATAMRDPVFYRLHAFVDDMFHEHKNTLPAYEDEHLNFPGVEVTGIEICSYDEKQDCRAEKNILHTFMMKSDINLSRGLDFTPRGAVLARVTHLNHEHFAYTIKVNNTSKKQLNGTVRVFIAPAQGFGNFNIGLAEQRYLMIEMDKFVAILKPGNSTILRQSHQSSVTIPFEQTFRNLDINRPDANDWQEFARFNYCGCGWPQHLLVPKGTPSGYPMVLFVMISDYDKDRVDQENSETGQSDCRTGVAFCGLRDKKYPDKRPMGYPFDRRLHADTLTSFMTPNMATQPITIMHSEQVREGNLVSENAINAKDLRAPPGTTNAAPTNELGQKG